MADISDFKEQLESAQSSIESAGYNADQAADDARAAVSNADQAISILSSLIEEVEGIMGYSKHDLEVAFRHLGVINKLQAMFYNRLDNVIDGNYIEDKMKYNNFISFLEMITESENGQLVWEKAYRLEAYYVDSTYGYKTVKSEEV